MKKIFKAFQPFFNKFNIQLKQTEMKTQRTIYHFIVDKSGSMSDCIPATINGYNEQVSMIKNVEAEFPEQDITIGLSTFNNSVEHKYFMQMSGMALEMNTQNYRPNGGTALYDAIGTSIEKLEEYHTVSGEQLPTTVVVVILTDGYENASRIYNLSQIKSKIESLESTGNWTFSFIGATLDAADVAARMSIKRSNSFAFDKSNMESEVWNKMSNSMRSYSNKKRMGDDLSELF
jgi:hypothetical protein